MPVKCITPAWTIWQAEMSEVFAGLHRAMVWSTKLSAAWPISCGEQIKTSEFFCHSVSFVKATWPFSHTFASFVNGFSMAKTSLQCNCLHLVGLVQLFRDSSSREALFTTYPIKHLKLTVPASLRVGQTHHLHPCLILASKELRVSSHVDALILHTPNQDPKTKVQPPFYSHWQQTGTNQVLTGTNTSDCHVSMGCVIKKIIGTETPLDRRPVVLCASEVHTVARGQKLGNLWWCLKQCQKRRTLAGPELW